MQPDYAYYTEDPHGHHADPTSEPVENDFGYPLAMQSERWSHDVFGYRFGVPPGYDRYRVELYFQEGYFGVNVPGDPVGRRVFDIAINGTVVQEDFDVAREAGGSLKGIRLTFDVPIADGRLDIQFRPVVSNPKVNIIRAYPIDQDGNPMPEVYAPGQPEQAWADLKDNGFRDAIDPYQRMVRDMPSQGGLVSAAGGRWYATEEGCQRCASTAYKNYERQIVAELPVAPPEHVEVRGTPTGSEVSWRPHDGHADGIVGYHVYRRPVAGGDLVRLTEAAVTCTSFDDTIDGEFVYAVTAVSLDGAESPPSYEETVQAGSADDQPPRLLHIPRNLQGVRGESVRVTAIAVDGRAPEHVAVTLFYRELGDDRWQRVEMQRNALARPYAFFADIPGNAVRGASIEYYMAATDGATTAYAPGGAPAATASVLVQPDRPDRSPGALTRVDAEWDADAGGVMLSWRAAKPATHQYNVYRSTTPDFTPTRATYVTYVPAGQPYFLDVNVEPGVRYYYAVQAETIDQRTGPARHTSAHVP